MFFFSLPYLFPPTNFSPFFSFVLVHCCVWNSASRSAKRCLWTIKRSFFFHHFKT